MPTPNVRVTDFKEKLPIISKAIEEATFLSIDGEFTGLSHPGYGLHAYDTPEERYHKLRQGAADFLLVQFGLCTFKHNPETNKYLVHAFNFYVFPRPFSRQAPDIRFSCQSSSIDFLVSQGFDFNKTFRHGISYLPSIEEQRLKESLELKYRVIDSQHSQQFSSPTFTSPTSDSNTLHKGPIPIPEEHKEFVENTCAEIEKFLKSDETALALEPSNGFLRKLIYQTAANRFKSQVHLVAKTNEKKQRYISVSRVSGDDAIKELEQEKRKAEFAEIEDAVGFCKVIKMISLSGKLVVGHNMLLDLIHIISSFCMPLPEDYEDFKSLTRTVFPRLLDTKLMSSTQPFKERIHVTALPDLLRTLEFGPFKKPQLENAEGFEGYNTLDDKMHQAGYDAYITGICYLGLSQYLGELANPEQKVLPDSPLLEPFLNKLFLMRIQDIPYMNLAAVDVAPSREHVFHLRFPKDWKASDISQLFSPFGGIHIAWLDESSAFVSLYRRDQSESVLTSLSHGDGYKVMTYKDYMAMQRIMGTPVQAQKRRTPTSDVDLPIKRKRSRGSGGGSPFPGMNTITTIPEEEEAAEDSGDTDNDKRPNKQLNLDEDMGEPLAKRSRPSDKNSTNSGEEQTFHEPSWD